MIVSEEDGKGFYIYSVLFPFKKWQNINNSGWQHMGICYTVLCIFVFVGLKFLKREREWTEKTVEKNI